MARKKEIDDNSLSRNWKLLLYPDNPVHAAAIDFIAKHYRDNAIWITHKNYDFDGALIAEGAGKPHVHFGIQFQTAFRRGAICKRIGLIDSDSGLPDSRFCMPVSGRFDRWLVYLTHISEPDKEQYSVADLQGSPALIDRYVQQVLEFQSKQISVRASVQGIIDWINSPINQDKVITTRAFASWILNSPFFRSRSDRLVVGCLQEHNQAVYESKRDSYLRSVSDSQSGYQMELRRAWKNLLYT